MDSHLRRPPLVVLGLLSCTALLWIVPAQATSGAAGAGLPAHLPPERFGLADRLAGGLGAVRARLLRHPASPDTVRYMLPRVEVRAPEPLARIRAPTS